MCFDPPAGSGENRPSPGEVTCRRRPTCGLRFTVGVRFGRVIVICVAQMNRDEVLRRILHARDVVRVDSLVALVETGVRISSAAAAEMKEPSQDEKSDECDKKIQQRDEQQTRGGGGEWGISKPLCATGRPPNV